MAVDITALRAELDNDPDALGYQDGGVFRTAAEIQDIINLRRAAYSVLRKSIPMGEIYAQVEWISEWLALPATEREGFRQLTSTDTLDASSVRIRSAMEAIFGSASATWANLAAIVNRDASRAENLWGTGTLVTRAEVNAALAL